PTFSHFNWNSSIFCAVRSRMQSVSLALEELLVSSQEQNCLTVGIYESAKFLNVDPDSVVLCVLAADHEEDVALQIHFTLLQSFCCNSGITILQVSGIQRLHQLLGAADVNKDQDERKDLHCLLVTVCLFRKWEVGAYCQESLRPDQWVPTLILQER
uniref:Growth arrest and DNA damage inducible beta n=1 Tax=Oryzias sinensis TaxID=183150 RepID=A0A8C7ZLC8_9TELE